MPFFEHDGIEFYHEDHGAGAPLIFSHGLGGNVQRSLELLAGLPECRVVVYDNRGHGRTAPIGLPGKLNFTTMSDDMAALLDHLGIAEAFAGGVSMGAGVALTFAVRHPQRVRALVLNRPAWLDAPHPANLSFTGPLAELVGVLGSREGWARFETTGVYRELYRASPDSTRSLRDVVCGWNPEALVACYRFIPASVPVESLHSLAKLDVPALVLANRNDPIHPYELAETLARALPQARLREIPSRAEDLAGHLREFRENVAGFLHGLEVEQ